MTTMTSDTIYVYCWWFIGDETQVWRQQEMSLWKVLGPVEVGRSYFDSYGLAQKNFLVQRTQRNCWTCVAVQNFISARTFHFHEFHFSSYPAGKNMSSVFASIFQKKGKKVSLTWYEMRTWNKEKLFLFNRNVTEDSSCLLLSIYFRLPSSIRLRWLNIWN